MDIQRCYETPLRFANEYLTPVALSGKNRTTTLCREADDGSIEQDRALHRRRQPPRDRQDVGLRDLYHMREVLVSHGQ
jgi:hypothetical protein